MSTTLDEKKKKNVIVANTNNENWFKIVAIIFAFFIIVSYAFFIYFLIGKANSEEDEIVWTRLIYLFSGVEAIVFSAVGFIFGREVNRSRAEKAEGETKNAQKNEIEAREKATKAETNGKAIALQILNKIEKSPSSPEMMNIRGISTGKGDDEILDLAKYVEKIYPDLK